MELLGAVAAFAVIMIVFSTAVSGVVEALLRLSAERPEVLFRAVRGFANDALVQWIEKSARKEGETLFVDGAKFQPPAKGWEPRPENDDDMRRKVYFEVLGDLETVTDEEPDEFRGRFLDAYVARKKQDGLDRVVDQLTLNPLNLSQGNVSVAGRGFLARRRTLWTAGIDSLTTYALIQRLAKSEVGGQLAETARGELRPILEDLSRTFERYVASSNEVFRKNANGVAVFVAFALAFGTNFDASRVFTHLVKNPSIAEALIAQGEEAARANALAAERLADRLEALAPSKDQTGQTERETTDNVQDSEQVAPDTPPPSAPSSAGTPPEEQSAGDAAQTNPPQKSTDAMKALPDDEKNQIAKDLQSDMANLEATLKPIVEEGDLPFGADYYPYCLDSFRAFLDDPLARPRNWWYEDFRWRKPQAGSAQPAFNDTAEAENVATRTPDAPPPNEACRDKAEQNFTLWLLNVILAGALISLGGPFWYKVFASFSRLAQLARQFAGGARSEKVGPEGDKEEGKAPVAETPLETFETARANQAE